MSFCHMCAHTLPTFTATPTLEQCMGAWLVDGAFGWHPPVMTVGWIPCLESSRP